LFALRPGLGLESWLGSAEPSAVDPFQQDSFHFPVGGEKGDVGVTQSSLDVNRCSMVGLPHHPAGRFLAVKPIPFAHSEDFAAGNDL
jgi:hypothetical protein